MPKRPTEQLSAERAIASGAWSLPAWQRYKRTVEAERTQSWLLVALAALALWPIGCGIAYLAILPLAGGMGLLAANPSGSSPYSLAPLFGMSALSSVMYGTLSILLPLAAVVLAVTSYRRQYQLTVRDLVYGNMALMLIDESYGQVVELAAQERYRPNPNRVDFGFDFAGRVNHFAHYYAAYYRLSWGPADVSVPFTIERNCWAEGALLGAGLCTTYCCLGLLLTLPLSFRAIIVWPRLLAIKQAVLEYFGGRFDAAWEQPLPPPRSTPPAG